MKKLLLPLLAAIVLSACNGTSQSGNTEENDSISASIDSTSEESNATQSTFFIKTETFSDRRLFQYGDKKVYHENSISIDWPVSAEGFDLKALQKALREAFDINSDDIQKYVKNMVESSTADEGSDLDLVPVSKRDEDRYSEEVEESDDDTFYPMYDTDYTLNITYQGHDSIHNTVLFENFSVVNNGCGMGSCIFPYYQYLTFDCTNNKVITIDNIIANEKQAVKELKKQRIGSENYGGLDELNSITALPREFYIDGDNVMVVFTKYEISYGADGCPMLGFNVKKCPQVLTEYGKKLFGIEE